MTRNTPFMLVYGKEEGMIMEVFVASSHVVAIIGLINSGVVEITLSKTSGVVDNVFVAGFYQQV